MDNYLSIKIKVISFVSIVMVVILHCYNLDTKHNGVILEFEKDYNWFIQNFVSYGITRIAVPMFFVISGYLFFFSFKGNQDFFEKIKKRFFTILIPFLFWSGFGIFFYLVLQTIPQSRVFFSKKLIVDFGWMDWWNALVAQPISYQLWFLRDLIVLTVLSPILFLTVQRLGVFFLAIIFPFWLLTIDSIFLTSESLLFFCFGIFLCVKRNDLPTLRLSKHTTLLFLFLWIALLIVKTTLQIYLEEQTMVLILHKLSICIGVVAMWSLYDSVYPKIESKLQKLLPLFGFSFFIYVFHEPLLTLVKKGLFVVLGKSSADHFLIYLICGPLVIATSLFVGYFLKTKLADFYNFTTGNRR